MGDLQMCTDRDIRVRANPTHLLPNAPMNAPAYREKHGIIAKAGETIMETATYTRDEWNEMDSLRVAYYLLDSYGVLRYIARFVRRELASANRATLLELYRANEVTGDYRYDKDDIGRRGLRNSCLGLLTGLIGVEGMGSGEELGILVDHFKEADNMTDEITALAMLAGQDVPERADAMAAFHHKWKHEPLVINKWFGVQATSSHPQVVDQVLDLFGHPDFTMTNPNRARSLVGAFAMGNHVGFHRVDGAGYSFLADRVIELHELNPQVAARLVGSFNAWRRYDEGRQGLMKAQLERILAVEGLSKNVFEIVSKALV